MLAGKEKGSTRRNRVLLKSRDFGHLALVLKHDNLPFFLRLPLRVLVFLE